MSHISAGLAATLERTGVMHASAQPSSVHREKAVEHIFLAEISKRLLSLTGVGPEILRCEHDSFGYDLVLEFGGVMRHIQLKVMRSGGARSSVDVNIKLASKPGGCVLWIQVNEDTWDLGPFGWFGSAPGAPLPALGSRLVLHSKGNATGAKATRPGMRSVLKGRFLWLENLDEVIDAMFGSAHDLMLRAHLTSSVRSIADRPTEQWLRRVCTGDFRRLPLDLAWEESCDLAHVIDGYLLIDELGLGDPYALRESLRARAEMTGRWEGTATQLWLALFLEHRAAHFGQDPGEEDIARLLPSALAAALSALGGPASPASVRPQST